MNFLSFWLNLPGTFTDLHCLPTPACVYVCVCVCTHECVRAHAPVTCVGGSICLCRHMEPRGWHWNVLLSWHFHLLRKRISITLNYMCVCLCEVGVHESSALRGRRCRIPCEPFNCNTGSKLGPSVRIIYALNRWVTSPARYLTFLRQSLLVNLKFIVLASLAGQ